MGQKGGGNIKKDFFPYGSWYLLDLEYNGNVRTVFSKRTIRFGEIHDRGTPIALTRNYPRASLFLESPTSRIFLTSSRLLTTEHCHIPKTHSRPYRGFLRASAVHYREVLSRSYLLCSLILQFYGKLNRWHDVLLLTRKLRHRRHACQVGTWRDGKDISTQRHGRCL